MAFAVALVVSTIPVGCIKHPSLLVVPRQNVSGGLDDVIGGESVFLEQVFRRRGPAECGHADNCAIEPDVTLPAKDRARFDRYARLHVRRENTLAVAFILPLEDFPAWHADNASTNSFGG